MKLLLLGTTGYRPNDQKQTACLMLPELGIVLDAGTGMYRVRDYLCTPELDIFLTHTHLDHVVGLTYLFDVLHGKQVERVTVHATADKLLAIQQHLLASDLFPVPLPCDYQPLTGPVNLPEGGELSYFALQHPGGAIGLRLSWPDRSLAYVTDTTAGPDSAYIEHLRGVDLLIHECYFRDEQHELAIRTGHSFTTPVAQLAKRAGVGRLILVHVNPLCTDADPLDLAKARAIFPNTEIAFDRMEVNF